MTTQHRPAGVSTFFTSLFAPFRGVALCLSNRRRRSLALWPWLIGLGSYVGTLSIFFSMREKFVLFGGTASAGMLGSLWYGLGWLVSVLLVFLSAAVASSLLVMLFAGTFQSAIARSVLEELGAIPAESSPFSVSSVAREMAISVRVELVKILWMVPLGVVGFMLALFPLTTPVGIVISAWLLAYQFIDYALEARALGARSRLRFALAHPTMMLGFGGSLALLWAVPLLGILLAPTACAGGAWLVADRIVVPPKE